MASSGNPMVPTPTTPGMGYEESLYRGIALAQLRILKQQMQLGGLFIGNRRVRLDNGVEILCGVCFNKEDIYINIPKTEAKPSDTIVDVVVSAVIMHPRSGSLHNISYTAYIATEFGVESEQRYLAGVAGGWRDGTELIGTNYVYPLVDADNASFIITEQDGVSVGEFARKHGNYGNLYWWNGDTSEPKILSWKGSPARHFGLSSALDIPGLTRLQTTTTVLLDTMPVYTPFSSYVYQNGSVLAEAPNFSWPSGSTSFGNRCIVLGACVCKTNGRVYIAALSDRADAPEYVCVFSDGYRLNGSAQQRDEYLSSHAGVSLVLSKQVTKTGYWMTIWYLGGVVDGWSLVSDFRYTNDRLPVFADSDGMQFVTSGGSVFSVFGEYTTKTPVTGTYSETDLGNYNNYKFSASFNDHAMYEYIFNALSNATINCSVETYSDNSFPEAKMIVQHDPVEVVIPADGNIFGHIYVPSFNAAGDGFAVGGKFTVDLYWTCNCEGLEIAWDIPGTSYKRLNDYGSIVEVISSSGICGGTVTITVSSGRLSQSTSVVFPRGKWVIENSGSFNCERGVWDCPGGWAPAYVASCSNGSCFVYTSPWYSSNWGCAYTTCLKLKSQSETMPAFSVNTTNGSCTPSVYSGWGNVFATSWKTCSWVCSSDPRGAVDPNHLG